MNPSRRHFLAGSLGSLALLSAQDKDSQAQKLLAGMSLDEKIGQMTQADQMFLKSLDDIETYHLGSLLSGGDSDPKAGNDLGSWTDLYDNYQSRALKTRLRIPLLYGIDAVHGDNNVLGSVVFPHNIGLGCTRNPDLVETAARITAEEVRATGINWAFAPCLTVPQDIRWGRTYEGFSESPDVVKTLGPAAVRGFQRDKLDHPLAVLACAKHFAGDGGTAFGTGLPKPRGERYPLDQGDVRLDEAKMRRIHLAGYLPAIQAGVASIMPSYSSWNGVKCSGNAHLLTDILKKEFGFNGFVISDYNALDQLPGNKKEQIAQSINAGMDMAMVPEKYREFFNTLKDAVNEGKVPLARIDDAVLRILRVKVAMGLMDSARSPLADRSLHKSFGSAAHKAVARDCVRQSIVVLKNENKVLPLAKSARVHVAGKCADDIGNQCGGWTVSWQGKSGNIIQGTTILSAIRTAVGSAAQITYSQDGSGAEGSKIGIAIIGERPYAEFQGDRTDLTLAAEDVAVVDRLKSSGVPVIAILVSGRPLVIDAILGKADAIVAAWLPGTEGAGVADVLFGDHKPTGRLSFTWPRGDSTSFARGDAGYQTLFPFGHGLNY
jgi:beta-glucosidase